MKLDICIPTYDKWEAAFGHALALTMTQLMSAKDVETIRIDRVEGTLIHQARTDLAHNALKEGATHILWMDCDMEFAPNHVLELIKHWKHPIVGLDYWKRREPYGKVTKYFGGKAKQTSGLEEVRAIGFGMCLMQTDVFKAIPEPWFDMPYLPEDGGYLGEDIYFCHKARKAGFKTLVDHDTSRNLGHIGSFVFKDGMAGEEREAA